MTIDVGSIVGDYQVVAVLGAGGMGRVFKVRNVISDRIEAMKVLLPDLTGEPDLADRFLREIKVQASLSHPNIASLHTALRFENQLLMFMEFVEGVTLDQRRAQGRLSVADACNYIGQALSALSYAHQHGVVHRDIKPANMMLTADGVIKLMDFGIAKSATDHKLTMTGTTMGSMYYMSPEQIRGAQTLDQRSDLYSVGVSLYELVTGQRPFDGDSQFSIMSAHLEKDPKPPITLDPTLPPALNEIILTALQREPERRFQSADAFRKALSTVAPSLAPPLAVAAAKPAPAPVAAAPAPAPKSRRGLWVVAGAVCAVAAIVLVVEFGPFRKAGAVAPETTAPAPAAATAPTPAAPAPAVETPPAPQPSTATASAPAPPPTTPAPASRPARAAVAPSQPASAPPVSGNAPPAQATSVPPSSPNAPPAPSQPAPDLDAQKRRAEAQAIRESIAQLSARASGIRSTLQNLQRSQAAGGLGLRRDWIEAAGLMDSFLRGAMDALAANDTAAARDLMNKAEIQIDKLDKALR